LFVESCIRYLKISILLGMR